MEGTGGGGGGGFIRGERENVNDVRLQRGTR
jgi:hypothetical protein